MANFRFCILSITLAIFSKTLFMTTSSSDVVVPAPLNLTSIRLSSFFLKNYTVLTPTNSSSNTSVVVVKILWLTNTNIVHVNHNDFAQSVGAVNWALERLARERILTFNNSNTNFDLEIAHVGILESVPTCTAYNDLSIMLRIYYDLQYAFDAVIGPPCDDGALAVNTFAESIGRPHILWTSPTSEFDVKSRYPHVTETFTDIPLSAECVIEMIHQLGGQRHSRTSNDSNIESSAMTKQQQRPWSKLALLTDSDSYSCNAVVSPAVKKIADQEGLKDSPNLILSYTRTLSGRKSSDDEIRQMLREASKVARIFLLCTTATLSVAGQEYDSFSLRILSQAFRMGMLPTSNLTTTAETAASSSASDNSKQYMWLLLSTALGPHYWPPYAPLRARAEDVQNSSYSLQWLIEKLKLPITEPELYEIYRSTLMFDQDWGGDLVSPLEFNRSVMTAAFQPPWNVNRTEYWAQVRSGRLVGHAATFSPHLADGIYLYGRALRTAIDTQRDFRNPSIMSNIFRNISFVGVSGHFGLHSSGKRLVDILAFAPVQNYYDVHPLKRYVQRGVMRCASMSPQEREKGLTGVLDLKTPLEWPNYPDHQPPPDTPVCGWNSELCIHTLSTLAISLIATGSSLALILFLLIFGCIFARRRRHQQRLKALLNTNWNLQQQDLTCRALKSSTVRMGTSYYSHQNNNNNNSTETMQDHHHHAAAPHDGSRSTINTNFNERHLDAAPVAVAWYYKQKLRVKSVRIRSPALMQLATLKITTKSSSLTGGADGAGSKRRGSKTMNSTRKSAVVVLDVHNLPLAALQELRTMKDLEHDNVLRFIGVVLDVAECNKEKEDDGVLPDNNASGERWAKSVSKAEDSMPTMLVVSAYCSKGSLDNILYGNDGSQQQQQLDWLFKYSFMCDIAAGLAYLHAASALKWHGRLRTRAVLLDARWTCKLADYGLWSFTDNSATTEISSQKRQEKLLWTAPEVLRSPLSLTTTTLTTSTTTKIGATDVAHAHQAADVYSFGVILSEIIYQVAPFEAEMALRDLSVKEVLNLLRNHNAKDGKSIIRPTHDDIFVVAAKSPNSQTKNSQTNFSTQITNFDVSQHSNDETRSLNAARQLMLDCWQESPASRPNVKNIVRRLRQLNGRSNNEQSIVDRVIAKLETYAENLEGIVRERTGELLEEQARADALLSRMLPASVARALKHGEPVVPEQYDEATVFFSDVVSFTTIASLATPMQVVQLLNDLYTFMDGTLDRFMPDVYKVETIGDAYMVVSGIPQRTHSHARILASVALSILANIGNAVRAPHALSINGDETTAPEAQPQQSVQLRVGLNSGACVAGVVGLAMPRYCLFGDTVNVASRMESTSAPMRVHISASTREELVRNWPNDFSIEERGAMQIKGKGEMTTYWLNDSVDFRL